MASSDAFDIGGSVQRTRPSEHYVIVPGKAYCLRCTPSGSLTDSEKHPFSSAK